jgi:hypothetical protein
MVTEQMIDRAIPVFKLRTHPQPAVRPEKWDEYDREAVRELLEAALAPRDSQQTETES